MHASPPALVAALALAGCAGVPAPAPLFADCRGVIPSVAEFSERADAALLADATAPPGEGKLCGDDRVIACSLRPGTPLVLGRGQSVASCPAPQAGLPQAEAI